MPQPQAALSACPVRRRALALLLITTAFLTALPGSAVLADDRPNIVFAIADDWGFPHASALGDPVVKTPAFDRIAKKGILFRHGFISSPSCTPSRGAILTGQYHWRLGGAGNLWSVFPDRLATYPELLAKAGYVTGLSGKGWGPGRTQTPKRDIAGKRYRNFQQFMSQRDKDKPFVYWLGTSDPHRPFKLGSGKQAGMDLSKIKLPACFPDSAAVRGDVADYYVEVQRFDALVAAALKSLEDAGVLENTIVVMTSDHGMPFPRCKSNLYDDGARVPLVVMWPAKIKGNRDVTDFVSLCDLAPTFLEAAGVDVPEDMTGRSLMPIFASAKSGRVTNTREHVIFGKERHVPSQEAPDMGGYPGRAIRNDRYLYIRNYKPNRWPNGTPHYDKAAVPGAWFADTDNGPTKTYIVENKDKDATHRRMYDLCFAKRPAVELYDLSKDPGQINNVAKDAKYAKVKADLAAQLEAELKASGDPRAHGKGDVFDKFPYLGGAPKYPGFKRPRKPKAPAKSN